MRAVLVALATICIAPSADGAEAPFVPPGVTPPDYVATVVEKDAFGGKSRTLTITHHGDWSRATLDAEPNGRIKYFATNGILQITAQAAGIGFSGASSRDAFRDYELHNTGETQTYLGETCTVWDIERTRPEEIKRWSAMTRLSCITEDGIELWQKRSYKNDVSSLEATHIERRPVAAQDTAPPVRLALDWWDRNAPAPAPSDIPDSEAVMKLPERHPLAVTSFQTHHRSGQWKRVDETFGARRHIQIAHEPSGFFFTFWTDAEGRLTSLNMWRPGKPADPPAAQLQPKALDRYETVVGESCRWFDMAPGLQDASMTACLAQDGVALAEENSCRPCHPTVWTAVSVSRRTVTADEMKPPAELFDPQTWLR
jgi:hypothetical protein